MTSLGLAAQDPYATHRNPGSFRKPTETFRRIEQTSPLSRNIQTLPTAEALHAAAGGPRGAAALVQQEVWRDGHAGIPICLFTCPTLAAQDPAEELVWMQYAGGNRR